MSLHCIDSAAIVTVMTKTSHKASATRSQMNMRIAANDRALFDLAADILGTSRSEFMLSASRQMAEATLLNRRLFPVDEAIWNEFVEQLDGENQPDQKGLEKLKSASIPWKN